MEVEFSTLFPAADPVAHFVVSLAVASNDLVQARTDLDASTGYVQITHLRQLLTHLWETHLLVQGAAGVQPVAAFVDRVASAYTDDQLNGTTLVKMLTGQSGVSEPRFRNVFRVAREWSVHYPTPNDAALVDTLRTLAQQSVDGSVADAAGTGDSRDRLAFADEVMARLAFPFPETVAEERLTQVLGAAADVASAVIRFARTAVATWSAERLTDVLRPPSGYPTGSA